MELIKEKLTKKIIGAALEVNRYWGPGLLKASMKKPSDRAGESEYTISEIS